MVSVFINPRPIWTMFFFGFHGVFICLYPKSLHFLDDVLQVNMLEIDQSSFARVTGRRGQTKMPSGDRRYILSLLFINLFLSNFISNFGYLFVKFMGRTKITKSQSHKRKGYYTSEQLTKPSVFLFLNQNDHEVILYDCTIK